MAVNYSTHYLINPANEDYQDMFAGVAYTVPAKGFLPLVIFVCEHFRNHNPSLIEVDNEKDLSNELQKLGRFQDIFGVCLMVEEKEPEEMEKPAKSKKK